MRTCQNKGDFLSYTFTYLLIAVPFFSIWSVLQADEKITRCLARLDTRLGAHQQCRWAGRHDQANKFYLKYE